MAALPETILISHFGEDDFGDSGGCGHAYANTEPRKHLNQDDQNEPVIAGEYKLVRKVRITGKTEVTPVE